MAFSIDWLPTLEVDEFKNEQFSERRRAEFLLEKGDGLQKRSVLSSLKHLLSIERAPELVQAFLDQSHKLDDDQLVELARGLLDAQSLLPGECLLPVLETASSVLAVDSEVLCEDWGKVVEAVSRLAQLHEVRDTCVPLALSLCSSSRPTYMRRIGALLIGVLGEVLGRFFPQSLVEKVKVQSQDASYEMRKTMCRVFNKLSEDLGIAEQLYPSLELLLHDDDSRVREEAVTVLLCVFPSLSEETVTGKAMVSLQAVTEHFPSRVLAKLGTLLPALSSFPSTAYYSETLLNMYVESFSRSEEHKVSALSILPGVARAVDQATFESRLVNCYLLLSNDDSVAVRKAAAAVFHHMSTLMNTMPGTLAKLKANLLRDSELQGELLEHIDAWPHDLLDEAVFLRLKEFLLSKQSWRNKEEFLRRITSLVTVELSCLMSQHVAPALFSLMREECAALRSQCVKVAVKILTTIYQSQARQELVAQLCSFASSAVYRDRLLFLDIFLQVVSVASRRLVKASFFPALLPLSRDPVVPVRLKFASSLSLIRIGIDKEDADSRDALFTAMVALAEDKDPLVSSHAADQQILMSSPTFIEKVTNEEREVQEAERIQREDQLLALENSSREEAKQRFVAVIGDKVRRDTKKKLSAQIGNTRRSTPQRPTGKIVRGSFSFSESRSDTPPRTQRKK